MTVVTTKRGDQHVWRELLAGRQPEIERNVPCCGVWRARSREGKEYPVNIYRAADGQVWAWSGISRKAVPADESWCENNMGFLLKRPLTAADYQHWLDHGRFPDEVDSTAAEQKALVAAETEAAHNGGINAEQHVIIRETIAELRKEAEEWLASIGGKVETQEHANKAGNLSDRFAELQKEADKSRVAEKEPILKQQREIDGKWQPVVQAGDEAKRWAKGLLTDFLRAEQAKRLAAAAESASQGEAVDTKATKVKAGTRGRAVTLRTRRVGTVSDPAAFAAWLVQTNNPDMRDLLHKLAQRIASASGQAPGVEITEEQVAA